MNCLWCDERILPEISWENIFSFPSPPKLCLSCEKKLYRLEGKRCSRCSKEYDQTICPDCLAWDVDFQTGDPLTYNYSLYAYNMFMREVLARWKYRGDYQLGEIFRRSYKESFRMHFPFEAVVIPIPLSEERMAERAFNQSTVLASFLPADIQPVLSRIHHEKQSKKSRRERLRTMNPFELTKPIKKPVILVDDLFTTGVTLRHAAMALKENGTPQVYAYTLIRA